MAKPKTKPMHFTEICEEKFTEAVQREFERIQRISAERGSVCRLKLEITVGPTNEDNISEVSFSHQVIEPHSKSAKYSHVRERDVIVRMAEEEPEQENLVDFESEEDEETKTRGRKKAAA